MKDYLNKNVVIIGGASGIGLAIAEQCAQRGGRVLIADLNYEAAMLVSQRLGLGSQAYKMDLSNTDEIRCVMQRMIDDVEQIHVLINCAGIVSTKSFIDLTQEEWNRVIAVNLTGTFAATHAVFSHMKEHSYGSIVNIASVAAKVGGGLLGTGAYAASKAGVIGLTKAVAREGAPFGIRCNALCPSLTKTPMTEKIPKEQWDRIVSGIPLGRAAEPVEIANTVLFLASDAAGFVTGEIAVADGGICMDG